MRKEMYDLVMKNLEERLTTHGPIYTFTQDEILILVSLSIKTVMADMLLNGTYYKNGGR